MPAGFTHIILSKTFAESANFSPSVKDDLVNILDFALDYFQLGSIGPDLPYSQLAMPLDKEHKIADKFHYELTNQIPIRCLKEVRSMPYCELKLQFFGFFCGYISHIIADGVIHPFVRDKVGPYKDFSNEHRLLEMRLDVLFLEHLSEKAGSKTEINNAKIQDELASASSDFDEIANLFSVKINEIYNEKTSAEMVKDWAQDMEFLFESAANEHNQYYQFIPKLSGYLYKNSSELKSNKDQDLLLKNSEAVGRANNFRNMDTHFFNDCVPEYYKKLAPIIEKAYLYVFKNGTELSEEDLPAINLDTGRLLKYKKGYDLDQKAEFWG